MSPLILASDTSLENSRDKRTTRLAQLTGAEIMLESLQRHELYPYVYEEQTLVLMDAKQHRDVRRIQRYSRLEANGAFKALIKFTYPESIAGASLLLTREQNGLRKSQFNLPALGASSIGYEGAVAGSQILGSEFSMEDLAPEDMHAFSYHRSADIVDGDMSYFVVQAKSIDTKDIRRIYAVRKLLIRQDNFFVTHIDYLDSQNRLIKKQTRHAIRQINGDMWRADMMMVENYLNHHRSILKIDRRVYSSDYVPESLFETSKTVFSNEDSVVEPVTEESLISSEESP